MLRPLHQRLHRLRHPASNHRRPPAMGAPLELGPLLQHRHLPTWMPTLHIGTWFHSTPRSRTASLTCRTGLPMATTLTRPNSKSGKRAKWRNTTNITRPRDTQLLALMALLRGLVVHLRLLRLPVSQRHHHRPLLEHLRSMHAQICRPNLYMCLCHCGRLQYIMDLVPIARL